MNELLDKVIRSSRLPKIAIDQKISLKEYIKRNRFDLIDSGFAYIELESAVNRLSASIKRDYRLKVEAIKLGILLSN